MKELSIEQKAERYDEVIEGIQEILSTGEDSIKMSRLQLRLQGILPELKENADEKIRKNLITFFKEEYGTNSNARFAGIKVKDVIAWLEKQGTPKEFTVTSEAKVGNGNIEALVTDKVQLPKFKVGDWIINAGKFKYKYPTKYLIKEIKEHYVCEDLAGKRVLFTFNYIHKHFKLWDISDATDGDVLYDGNNACLFRKKMKDDSAIWVDAYCGIDIEGVFQVNDKNECWCLACDCIPATKEQRDILFKAMVDAGYEFNFEKKELKKIKEN